MHVDDFWKLIDRVHAGSPNDMIGKCEALRTELLKLSEVDLTSFMEHFGNANVRAYDWKLWRAAYLINGGCSDDTFWDFRATLISMGRAFYEQALAVPDSLVDFEYNDATAIYEGFRYVASRVAEERFGEIPERSKPFPSEPSGASWDEDELPTLLPKLSEKFA